MAAKDRWEEDFECAGCKQKGTAEFSENDYPFMRSLDRDVRLVSGDFSVNMKDDKNATAVCNFCQAETLV